MSLTDIFFPLKAWRNTAIPPDFNAMAREKSEAITFFKEMIKKQASDQPHWTEEEKKKARTMLEQLGAQYHIENQTVFNIVKNMLAEKPGIDYFQKKAHSKNGDALFKEFQKAYKNLENFSDSYQELFALTTDENYSEKEKRDKLYANFEKNPIAILICVADPISKSQILKAAISAAKTSKEKICAAKKEEEYKETSPYQLMEYIFEDPTGWERVVKITLQHYKTIGLCHVDKLLFPVIEKALSLDFSQPNLKVLVDEVKKEQKMLKETQKEQDRKLQSQAHQALIQKIILANDSPIQVSQCPKVVAALLENPELVSDYLLGRCALPYLSQLERDQIDMEKVLSQTGSSQRVKDAQKENNRISFREKYLEALYKPIEERKILIEKQEVLLAKNSWLFNDIIEIPSLEPKKALDLIEGIIAYSDATIHHNNLWAQAGIINIKDICVQLLLNVSGELEAFISIDPYKNNFIHSATSKGKETFEIIQSISKETRLHHLLQKYCDHTNENNSPLEAALKANNAWEMTQILIDHTESVSIWRRLVKTEHHQSIQKKSDSLKLIENDYHTVSHFAYRRLNKSYRRLDNKIRDLLYSETAFEKGSGKFHQLIAILANKSNVLTDVLVDHLEYLEYILKLAHTNWLNTVSFKEIFKCDGFTEALAHAFSDPQLKETLATHSDYPVMHWWATLLEKSQKDVQNPFQATPKPSPQKNTSVLGLGSQYLLLKKPTPNTLPTRSKAGKNDEDANCNIHPLSITRLEEKAQPSIDKLLEKIQSMGETLVFSEEETFRYPSP